MQKRVISILSLMLFFYAFSTIKSSERSGVSQSGQASKDSSFQPFALMEIFTSEGCSNCPPAYKVVDRMLDKASQFHQNVMLLDYHVDYFNDPWVDPYSSPLYTERQENYGRRFPNAGVYTPEMVVNGNEALLASNSKRVQTAVWKAVNEVPVSQIRITEARFTKKGIIRVRYVTENIPGDSLIHIVMAQTAVVQKITSGENAGATLTHHNVVRSINLVKAKEGNIDIAVPATHVSDSAEYMIIAFRQLLPSLKITAAAQKEVSKDKK